MSGKDGRSWHALVRAVPCSPNHKAVPETKRTPASIASGTGDLYGLMPGDFTTTS